MLGARLALERSGNEAHLQLDPVLVDTFTHLSQQLADLLSPHIYSKSVWDPCPGERYQKWWGLPMWMVSRGT